MPLLYKPVEVAFGDEGMAALDKYVTSQVESLSRAHSDLHKNKVIQWRDWYYGKPAEENRSFPWDNCSNLVVQLIGSKVDSLKAIVLGTIYEVMPLVVAQLIGEWPASEQGEEQREVIEEFMNYVGLEPRELDLYRVENAVFTDTFRFGTGICKHPWETDIETEVIGMAGTESYEEREYPKYDGPRPEKVPLERFAITPTANTIESADFKYHERSLTKWQLLERVERGVYSKDAIASIVNSPDRTGPTQVEKSASADIGVSLNTTNNDYLWDIQECWFPYFHNGSKYRIIYTYHKKSRTKLKAVFNFYPDNMEPFKVARLGYTDDSFYGYGFCEMLHHYQEELSTIHNQDVDNGTLANTSVWRVDNSSRLDSQFSIYPMALLPFAAGEVEQFQLGRSNTDSIGRQQLTLSLANERAGIDQGTSGTGGGQTNPKKGVYSSMGTFSVMQAGNRRNNLNITDARYFHLQLCRDMLSLYSHFGIGERVRYFGTKGEMLTKALASLKAKKLALPIRAATASVNREIEKQNDMLLSGVMKQHYAAIAQILQTLPQAPEHMKKYLSDVIIASDSLMKHILRNFGHDDVSRLIPEPEMTKALPAPQQGVPNGNGQQIQGTTGENTGGNAVLQVPSGAQNSGTPVVGGGGGA